jgi:2-haloalkanoic acid dehalogenase type II
MGMDLTGVQALSFDCYGTLIDWESGIHAAMQPWANRTGVEQEREDLLALFGSIETGVQSETPTMLYPEVLAETLRRIANGLGVDVTDAEAAAFGASVGDWPAFPDSADALARLKERFKLIILSNVDRASFARSSERLGEEFDLVITAQDVGAYKPDQRNFDALFAGVASLGLGREPLVHVAESLYHDHEPAIRNELPSVWIHRRHEKGGFGATHSPGERVEPTWRFTSMAEFADAALS